MKKVPKKRSSKKAFKQRFPRGWDEKKVRALIEHYDNQSDEEGAAEIEAAPEVPGETLMCVPTELVPAVRKLIRRHQRSA